MSAHRLKSSGMGRRNWASFTALEPPVTLPRGTSISASSVALARKFQMCPPSQIVVPEP